MIETRKPLHSCISCNCCGSSEDVAEIVFRYENINQGTSVYLCRNCRAELAQKAIEPKPMIPQIRDFREKFQELHEETPRYVICNRRTFRELEIEAGIGYIPTPANKCPTVCGMVFKVPEDGEIIISNGHVEKYRFKGAK